MRETQHPLALAAALAVVLAPGAAGATGLCENTTSTWKLAAVSEQARQALVEGEVEWCEEKDDEEVRGTVRVAQLRTFDGKIVRWYADPVKRADDRLGAKGVRPLNELDAVRSKGAFRPIAELRTGAGGRCSSRVVVGETNDGGAEEMAPVTLELLIDGKKRTELSLGDAVATEEGKQAEALFLPTARLVLVWWSLPTCEGGPPPGYFGEDDPGECYTAWKTGFETIAGDGVLAGCFAAVPTEGKTPAEGGSKAAPAGGDNKAAPTEGSTPAKGSAP